MRTPSFVSVLAVTLATPLFVLCAYAYAAPQSASVVHISGKLVERRIETRNCAYRLFIRSEEAAVDHPRFGFLFPTRVRVLPRTVPLERRAPYFATYLTFSAPIERRDGAENYSGVCDQDSLDAERALGVSGMPREIVRGTLSNAEIELVQLRGVALQGAKAPLVELPVDVIALNWNAWTRLNIPLPAPQHARIVSATAPDSPLMLIRLRPSSLRGPDGFNISPEPLGPFPVDTSRY
jgi:hypothetical protein